MTASTSSSRRSAGRRSRWAPRQTLRTNSRGSGGRVGRGVEAAVDRFEARRGQELGGLLGPREVRRIEAAELRRTRRAATTSATARVEARRRCRGPRTGPRGARRRASAAASDREEPGVVVDPVEDGVAEDGVDRVAELELGQVRLHDLGPRRVEQRRAPRRPSPPSRRRRSRGPAAAGRAAAA